MQVNHDKKLLIATGRSRKATQWQNREMLWSEFLDKLSRPTRTRETVAEYAAMSLFMVCTSLLDLGTVRLPRPLAGFRPVPEAIVRRGCFICFE